MVITEGRLLHGTGINHTDAPRVVMLNGMQLKPTKGTNGTLLSSANVMLA